MGALVQTSGKREREAYVQDVDGESTEDLSEVFVGLHHGIFWEKNCLSREKSNWKGPERGMCGVFEQQRQPVGLELRNVSGVNTWVSVKTYL